jgi:hypothetical protein
MRLRALVTVVSGRYLEKESGRSFCREELYHALGPDILQQEIRMRKKGQGIYEVFVQGPHPVAFDLYSRRRRPRAGLR